MRAVGPVEQRRWIAVSSLVFSGELCFRIRLETLVYLLLRGSLSLSREGQGCDLRGKEWRVSLPYRH